MRSVKLLHHTPVDILSIATAVPYQSKPTRGLVKRVWDSQHRSIARHGFAVFEVKGVSKSLLGQISRHPHLNLTVQSTRYCDMTDAKGYKPSQIERNSALLKEYDEDYKTMMTLYKKWLQHEKTHKLKDVAKLWLPSNIEVDLIVSGNYQGIYEALQLRNCTRTEENFRTLSREMTLILKDVVPEIFGDLGCRGDTYGICPEATGRCGKHPSKNKAMKALSMFFKRSFDASTYDGLPIEPKEEE